MLQPHDPYVQVKRPISKGFHCILKGNLPKIEEKPGKSCNFYQKTEHFVEKIEHFCQKIEVFVKKFDKFLTFFERSCIFHTKFYTYHWYLTQKNEYFT